MNFRTRLYKPALLALAALLFCLVGEMQSRLNVDRKELGLTKMDPLENAPPVLAFSTVALGGFRGLIANALWIRMSELQQDDKFFEMAQLGDWITKLQPRMVAVWQFQAWNMAYNISVKFQNHEDRWHWVERGINLLRDDGLRFNPNETRIYHDLSWIFQHKVGANLDDAHLLYKLRWAQEMQNVLGGRPDFAQLQNPTTPEWKSRLQKLTNIYKMDPKILEQVDKEYGPFDWRLPDGQAVYWAEMGRIYGRPEEQVTLSRSIYQSLLQMGIRGGALSKSVTNVTADNFMLWPNLDQIPVINAAYEKMITEEIAHPNGLQKNMETAHKNFIKEAVYLLYEDGREKDAQQWYNYVKQLYTNAFVGKEAGMTMEQYSLSQITEDIGETGMDKVQAFIMGMIDREFMCLVMDNDDEAATANAFAKKIWNYYHAKIQGASQVRLRLKSLPELQRAVLERWLDPKSGLSDHARKMLMTKLNIHPPANAPQASASPQS